MQEKVVFNLDLNRHYRWPVDGTVFDKKIPIKINTNCRLTAIPVAFQDKALHKFQQVILKRAFWLIMT